MPTRYLPAAALAASYLDASTPSGLFQTYRQGKPQYLFLVVQDAKSRWAIALTPISRERFPAWELSAGDAVYHGVSLGDVTLEVDTAHAISHMEGEAGGGDVTLMSDAYFLRVARGNGPGGMNIRLGAAVGATSGSPPHVFKSWRLVRRDAAGNTVILFENRPPMVIAPTVTG